MTAAAKIKSAAQGKSSPVTIEEEDDDVAVPLGDQPEPPPASRSEVASATSEREPPPVSPDVRLTGERVARLVLCEGVTVAVGDREVFGTWKNRRGDGSAQDWTCEVAVHRHLGPVFVFAQRPGARPGRNDRPQYVPLLAVASFELEVAS